MSGVNGDPSVFQDTFEEIVQENIANFEMERDEAISDAFQQLKTQGIDTRFIVVDERASTIPGLIDNLSALISSSDTGQQQKQQLIPLLKQLQDFCVAGLSHRCLAGRRGAYAALVATLPSQPEATLQALTALQTGQPDLFRPEEAATLLSLLSSHPAPALAWAAAVTLKHEANRQALAEAGVLRLLAAQLSGSDTERTLLPAVCQLVRQMVMDDDVRVPYGKAHEHACQLVTEHGALESLLQLLRGALEEPALAAEIIHTCTKLCVRKEFCEQVASGDGVPILLSAMNNNHKSAVVVGRSFFFFRTLAGSDRVKDSIMKPELGAAQVIATSLELLKTKELVCEAAFAAIAALTLRSPANAATLASADVLPAMVAAMEQHAASSKVQKLACMAVRNMASRSPELKVAFRQLDVEPLINAALQTHGQVVDAEGRAALRDLDCSVSLKEEWTGRGGALTTGVVVEPERPGAAQH